jgi:hypothetical protein
MFVPAAAVGRAGFGIECREVDPAIRANTWFIGECRDRRDAADFINAPLVSF